MKLVKNIFLFFIMFSICISIVSHAEGAGKYNAKSIGSYLKSHITQVTKVKVYNSKTDPNNLLGRPGNYTGKADFYDSRISGNEAGTVEVFKNSTDCRKRWEYLKTFDDPSLGFMALKQYMIMYDKAIVRIGYDLTPKQAKTYKDILKKYFGKKAVKSTV